jgi:hypothetical protein
MKMPERNKVPEHVKVLMHDQLDEHLDRALNEKPDATLIASYSSPFGPVVIAVFHGESAAAFMEQVASTPDYEVVQTTTIIRTQ